MTSLNDDIQAVHDLQAQGNDLETSKKAAEAQAREQVKLLRERIQAGESTGDHIRDFVILSYGINPEVEQKFRDLEAKLSEHQGEFVLMVTKREHFPGCTGFGHKPRDDEYVVEEEIYIGVVASGELDLDTTRIHGASLPTGSHTRCRDMWRSEVELAEGNMSPGFLNDLALIGVEFKRRSHRFSLHDDGPDYHIDVKVGDDEVKAWFEAKGKKYLIVFQKSAKMLGRSLDSAPELEAQNESRRAAISKRLIELAQAGDAPKVVEEIKRLLAEAVELGMGGNSLISVAELCSKYEVPIS